MNRKCSEFNCLICGRKGYHSIVVSSCQSYVSASGTPLAKFLYRITGEEPCYSMSDYMCQQCFLLLDRLDTYQARAAEIQDHISTRYRDTKLSYFGSRQRISELIVSSLSNMKSFKNGTTLNVSDELSVTVFHEALPRRKIHSLNRTCFSNNVFRNKSSQLSSIDYSYLKRKQTQSLEIPKSPKKQRNSLSTLALRNCNSTHQGNSIKFNKESEAHPKLSCVKSKMAVSSNMSNDNVLCNGCSGINYTPESDSCYKDEPKPNSNKMLDSETDHSCHEDSENSSSACSTSQNSKKKSKSPKRSDSSSLSSKSSSSSSSSNSSSSSSSSSSVSNSSSDNDSSGDEESEAVSTKNNLSEVKNEVKELPQVEEDNLESRMSIQDQNGSAEAESKPTSEPVNVKMEQEESMPIAAIQESFHQNEEIEPFNSHLAQAVFVQNSLASNLLHSFLSTSLWINSSEHCNQNNNKSKNKQRHNSLQKETSEVTSDTLLNAADSIKDKKKRLELKNTGKSYINTKGKLIEAKRMWPQDCSRCPLKCNGRLSEEMRSNVFADYWGLGDYDRQREYLASHMEREERVGPSGHTRTVVLYFLTHRKKRLQVCRQFFLKTLDVSEKASRIVLEKKLKGEFGTESQPATLIDEVRNNNNEETS